MRYRLSFILVMYIIVSLFTGTIRGEGEEIPLVIRERAGIDWRNFPITIGFPVAKDNKEFHNAPKVVDSWNREVPSQAILAGKWPREGTPRWWLITILGSVNKGKIAEYRIIPGQSETQPPRRAIKVSKEGEEVVLENSLLRLVLSNDFFINKVWFNSSGRVSPSERDLACEKGRLLMRTKQGLYEGKNSRIKILETGPVRTVVSVRGNFYNTNTGKTNGFNYEGRLIFYGDSSFFNIDLTLTNEELTDWTEVNGAWVSFQQDRNNNSLEAVFGSGNKGSSQIKLKPGDHAAIEVFEAEKISWGGKAGSFPDKQARDVKDFGWLDLTGSNFGITLGIADFWQQFPKALRINGSGEMVAEIVPKSSTVSWGRGIAKTHNLTVLFHDSRDRSFIEQMRGIINAAPVGNLPASWYNRTEAFYNPLRADGPSYSEEMMIAAAFLGERSKGDFLNLFGPPFSGDDINKRNWGIFNYGDIRSDFSPPWVVKGEYWNNNQYDLPLLLLKEFIETEEPVFFDLAKSSLLHLSDVDLAHPSAADRITPGLDHVKSYRTGLPAEAEDFSYIKNRGLLMGYYLFGDYRSLELAIKVANRVCLIDGLNTEKPRSFGLGIMGALTGYEATGEEKYLFRAQELTNELLGFIKSNEGNIPSDFIYQVGIALEGILHFNRWHNDPELIKTIQTVADRVLYDFWNIESGLIQNMDGLTFTSILTELYLVTGEEAYRNICRTQFSKFLNSTEVLKARDIALLYRNLYTILNMKAKDSN